MNELEMAHLIDHFDLVRNDIKLIRMDYINYLTEMNIIKKHINDIKKILREMRDIGK